MGNKKQITGDKIVQGAWISLDDHMLLQQEARKRELRSSTALATIIIQDWCEKRRLQRAKEEIDSYKRRPRKNVRKTTGNRNQEETD